MRVRTPKIQVLYNSRDITRDIRDSLSGLTYSDAVTGKADEIDIQLQDNLLLWQNEWYPVKGDSLEVSIGYDDQLLPCGTFEIDEIALSGPPDQLTISGLSAGISKSLRTRRSNNYENQTLRNIAQAIASRHGLAIQGEIASVQIPKKMQSRETDLRFLHRVASEYGYVFSVRGSTMTFTEVYGLEAVPVVTELNRNDLINYSFTDKTTQTYKGARVSFDSPDTGALVEGSFEGEDEASSDELEIWALAESQQNAERIARAQLHQVNTKKLEGTVTVEGNPLLVSGNNIDLTGLGAMSGIFHIEKSTHRIDPAGGYVTTLDVKRIGQIDRARWVPRLATAQRFEFL